MASNLTGKKVFSSGSFAPTRGPVSAKGAQGYLQREVNKPGNVGLHGGSSNKGNDGKSDTRSGVAAAALARAKNWQGPPTPGPNNGANNGPRVVANPTPPKPTSPPVRQPPRTPPSTGGPGPVYNPEPEVSDPIVPPEVQVDDAGQLELPYNSGFAQQQLAAQQQYNAELMDLTMNMQGQQLEHAKNKRNLDLDYEDTKLNTLNGNASGGTAFSSRYGLAVGRNAQGYNNNLGDLESANTLFQQQSAAQQAAILAAFQNQLSQNTLNYGDQLSEDAGNLGFGTSDEPMAPGEEIWGGDGPPPPGFPGHVPPKFPIKNTPKPPKVPVRNSGPKMPIKNYNNNVKWQGPTKPKPKPAPKPPKKKK